MRPPESSAGHAKLLEAEDKGEGRYGARRIAEIDSHFCKQLHFCGACKNLVGGLAKIIFQVVLGMPIGGFVPRHQSLKGIFLYICPPITF
jgi:hypothetical protein